jgi:carbon-monoxide dehydrogenase large subunit
MASILPTNASDEFPRPLHPAAIRSNVSVVENQQDAPNSAGPGAGYPEGCSRWSACSTPSRAIDGPSNRAEMPRRNLVPACSHPVHRRRCRRAPPAPSSMRAVDFPACLRSRIEKRRLRRVSGAPRQGARPRAVCLGFGISTGLKGSGRGPFESAIVRVRPVRLGYRSTPAPWPMGQGL